MSTAGRRGEASTDDVRTETDPLVRSTLGAQQLLTAPIIVAVDGSRASSAALRVTAALAERDGAPIEAVLLEGMGPSGDMTLSAEALRNEPIPDSTRLGRVRRQLCAILERSNWKLHVDVGSFGTTISNLARTSGASLIVVGLGRRHRASYSLGGGAAGRVVQSSPVPVLAVAATARGLPRTAIVATDFSPTSIAAARAARELLAAPGTLYLVHVQPPAAEDSIASAENESWNAVYDEGGALQLERLASELALGDIKVVPKLAKGPLVETLVQTVSDLGAGLIACGSDNLNAFERLLVGYPPLELLRRADCSVLIAPYEATR